MPQMAAVVVKKADNSTNRTFDVLTSAGNDGNPSVWRQDTGAPADLPMGLRATVGVKTFWNGPKTARKVVLRYEEPHAVLSDDTNTYSSRDKLVGDVTVTVPQGMPWVNINESAVAFCNFVASEMFKEIIRTGYAPN